MDEKEAFRSIAPQTFDALLKEYPDVAPGKVTMLDNERYNVIPKTMKKRAGRRCLTKEQLVTLVDWKLSHGKWRPALQGLVQKNTDKVVRDQTESAFQEYGKATKESKQVKQAISILTKLQGIGPATASLILSVDDPNGAPFFSDELFRWCFCEDGKGHGWDRDIKYNIKEYLELFERVQEFKHRFLTDYDRDIAAVDMEKVAYVLGKRAMEGATGATGAGSKKRKAGFTLDDDLHEDTLSATRDDPGATMASNASSEKKQKQAERVDAKKANSEIISGTKKAKAKSTTPATAATARPKRGVIKAQH